MPLSEGLGKVGNKTGGENVEVLPATLKVPHSKVKKKSNNKLPFCTKKEKAEKRGVHTK